MTAAWWEDAIIYQLHVRAFRDSNADGVGDFRGLIQQLDYLQDLGVTAIWLLPFYPSPLRDDGYDIADYTSIHPGYGTLRDFRAFLREAHQRGLRVVTELVLNHTSDHHPWFKRARRAAPGTPERDFYVWSDTPDRYREARVIFKDFESSNWTWDPVANAYYWHRFYSHQPDLNFDNPEVMETMKGVMDFWLGMGVDGVRLDAVPYLIEREGTNSENLPETHDILKEFRRHVDERYEDRMLLAEANQWPDDAVTYFGAGDECHVAFHFPLMPRMFMATRMEDRYPVIDILHQTPEIPDGCRWALFLRNHDELTLEMVTDEERDYMYRVYADDPQARLNLGIRRRLAPLLGNNRRIFEMLNGLLFALPGTPVLYYGDEIGMGDNIYLGDRNGVRTPMQWSSDRNAGFSRTNPQRLYLPVIIDPEYHYEAVNVEAHQNNPHSLMWWMRRLIALRKHSGALSRGSLEFLYPHNRKVLAFLRTLGEERMLVVANLSRHAQYVELDLSEHEGVVPVELFGGTEFPRIGELPYLLTLGPHAFYWFSLARREEEAVQVGGPRRLPVVEVPAAWPGVFTARHRGALEDALPGYLRTRRWFGGKARRIRSCEIVEAVPVPDPASGQGGSRIVGHVVLVRVEYGEGDPETYALPLTAATAEESEERREELEPLSVLRLRTRTGDRLLHDALADPRFPRVLLETIARRRHVRGAAGKVEASRTPVLARARGRRDEDLEPRLIQAEQSNTSVVFGDRLILKVFRRPDEGVNPDLEIGRFLLQRGFRHVPEVAGALEYRLPRRQPLTLGILQRLVPNEGDAWEYTLDALGTYLEDALARGEETPKEEPPRFLELADMEPPILAQDTIGLFLESARLLGQRTGELHVALASDPDDPEFAPEPFSPFDQRSLYQSMRALTNRVTAMIGDQQDGLATAAPILQGEQEILARFRRVLDGTLTGSRIRVHGDFHLGQVLYTGRDFVMIDFEGEPARPLGERRIKRSPLRDVAGMLRSFHYASRSYLMGEPAAVGLDDPAEADPWLSYWYRWVSGAFLRGYLEAMTGSPLLPSSMEELGVLLEASMLEKALYEVAYEANNRPDWLEIPVRGVLDLLEAGV